MSRVIRNESIRPNEVPRSVLIAATSCPHHHRPPANSHPRFADRTEAGKQLAAGLSGCRQTPLVLGIPCGGVPVAQALARGLRAELDVILAQKLDAPQCSECTVGAVTSGGHVFPHGCACACADRRRWDGYCEALETRWNLLRMRSTLYFMVRTPVPIAGREVIVVDDGAVSGATLVAALQSVRDERPARLTAALPVAGENAILRARLVADEVVVLEHTQSPPSLACYYRDFPAVMDEDVAGILARATAPRRTRRAHG